VNFPYISWIKYSQNTVRHPEKELGLLRH